MKNPQNKINFSEKITKNRINRKIKEISMILLFLLTTLIFLSPIIISVLTLNFWYLFLFSVTWIPTIGMIVFMALLFEH